LASDYPEDFHVLHTLVETAYASAYALDEVASSCAVFNYITGYSELVPVYEFLNLTQDTPQQIESSPNPSQMAANQ